MLDTMAKRLLAATFVLILAAGFVFRKEIEQAYVVAHLDGPGR
jgi:hypothetical protein